MVVREFGVNGTKLQYRDYDGNWRAEEGTLSGGSGTRREVWIEGDRLYYNEDVAGGATRYLPFEASGALTTDGNFEIHGNWCRYITAAPANREWHTDTGHDDAYEESGYDDDHTNTGHDDTHSDTYYDEGHDDTHLDTGHDDAHSDYHIDEGIPHVDEHLDGYVDSHTDGYYDTHTDWHTDGYIDSHTNIPHSDTHVDVAYTDTHADKPELV